MQEQQKDVESNPISSGAAQTSDQDLPWQGRCNEDGHGAERAVCCGRDDNNDLPDNVALRAVC